MKSLYKSPVITVEELYKKDVLCDSPVTPTAHDNGAGEQGGLTGEISL